MKATITAEQFGYANAIVCRGLTTDPINDNGDFQNMTYFRNEFSIRLLTFCQWVIEMVADGKIEVVE